MKRLLLVFTIIFNTTVNIALADVRCVQEFLSQSAFDPGAVDGMWGRKTASALASFIDQAGISVEGGLGKENTTEICRVFSEDTAGRLLAKGKYRSYAIDIDSAVLANIDPKFFDFSDYEIYSGPNLDCAFKILREGPEVGGIFRRAEGELEIIDGLLVFNRHAWMIGHDQLANESYLKERSNLMLLKSGQIVGRTPYFWSYIQEGGASKRPVHATLSDRFEPLGAFPLGNSFFEVPGQHDMTGVLMIRACYS